VGAVLIVDDEPDVRLVARVILEAAGHVVEEAACGEEALDVLASAALPDVLLLDVRMPGIDGWEVLRQVRGAPDDLRLLPVVIFTADIALAEQAPMPLQERDFFLGKPFDPDDLISLIGAAVSVAC